MKCCRTEKDITPMGGLPHHGVMKDDYLMIKGCCVGPKKRIVTLRQILINQTSRVALEEIKLKDQSGISNRWEAMDAILHRIEKLVVGGLASSGTDGKFEYRILNLLAVSGEPKNLENFLWDMETYFQAARVPDAKMVSITSMYLTENAKLCWPFSFVG
ncbi:60S ribosomal protein L3-1 [Sesamum angolense]|uniref:60S ribosomal protein L3-1 n=1 Tax=Sesamum angolense TaxID=2727404 RepID=A0AAE1X4D8_9LAMI|nr:60S ribosomal protein L3-1 [Sesamum angolense]